MAAKRSKLCKTVGDWLFLGHLININEHALLFSLLQEVNLRFTSLVDTIPEASDYVSLNS